MLDYCVESCCSGLILKYWPSNALVRERVTRKQAPPATCVHHHHQATGGSIGLQRAPVRKMEVNTRRIEKSTVT